jgi:hypothetical protein
MWGNTHPAIVTGRETVVITICLAIYLVGVVVTTIGAYAEGRWFLQTGRKSAPNTIPAAAVAGLVWPLLVVGVAELGAFVALAKAVRRADSNVGSFG